MSLINLLALTSINIKVYINEGKFKWSKGLEIRTKINRMQLEGQCKWMEIIKLKRLKRKN